MRHSTAILIVMAITVCLAGQLYGETVYFLVTELHYVHGDSYVLPLTEPNDIAYARALVRNDPEAENLIVVAHIDCSPDCVNRDYLSSAKLSWSWHVTQFDGFAYATIEILDGWPGYVQSNCQAFPGQIGFWNYTVTAELGTDPRHWTRDFWPDNKINMRDFAILSQHWLYADCDPPLWCDQADLDKNGSVDSNDLRIFTDAWLSPFAKKPLHFDCWEYPRQCYGDADGLKNGLFWVSFNDLYILEACFPLPVYYGDLQYNPCADFDHDGDIDDNDVDIIETWLNKTTVPSDCYYCEP